MSVWGRVHAAAHQADDHKELKDGEEECGICLSFATELKFKPCGHHACSNCLPQLRRANIFKADAGIKCPFCRQYIDQYEPLDARTLKDERARSLIHEANMAAKAAAMKRDSSNQQAPAAEARPPPSVAQQDNWECTSCDNLNFGSRTKCNRCNAAPPTRTSSSGGLGTTFVTSKDLMQCSHEEILVFATQKLHPNLNRAFAEAGTPYVDNRVGGSRETILAALAKKGQDKLVRIAHLLASCRHVPDLATHFYGNYTLQDLLDATAKLRGVAEQLRTQGKHPPEVMNRLAGGAGQQDAFGELVAAVTPEAARISTHINGTFVVQKCVALGSAAEQVALGRELLKAGLKLMEDQKSMHVMTKLVEGLHAVAMSWDPLAGQAGDVLETLCTLYAKADAAARNRAAHHYFAGQILVASIHGALPRPSAMRLLDQLAQQVVQLSLSKSGGNTLKLLCGLQSPDHKCQDLIATSVCVAASKCEGQFATIAARPGTDGAELVAAMLERLVEEREVDWVLCITSDLVANAGALEGDRAALDLLAKALCLDALDDQIVADHLKVLSTLLRRPQAVGDQVCKQRPGVKPLLAPPAPPASPPAPPVSTSGLPNGSPAPPPPTPLTMGRTPVMQSSPAGAEGPVGATTSSQPQPPPQHVKTPPGFAGQAGPSGTRQANPASPPRHQAKSQAPPAAPAQQAQQAKQAQQPPAVSRPPATAPFPPPPPAPLAASQAPQQGASSSSSSSAPAVPNMMGFLPHMMAQPSAAQQPPAQSSVAQRPPVLPQLAGGPRPMYRPPLAAGQTARPPYRPPQQQPPPPVPQQAQQAQQAAPMVFGSVANIPGVPMFGGPAGTAGMSAGIVFGSFGPPSGTSSALQFGAGPMPRAQVAPAAARPAPVVQQQAQQAQRAAPATNGPMRTPAAANGPSPSMAPPRQAPMAAPPAHLHSTTAAAAPTARATAQAASGARLPACAGAPPAANGHAHSVPAAAGAAAAQQAVPHPVATPANWTCQVCTYAHQGPEAQFLQCAVCGTAQGASLYGATR